MIDTEIIRPSMWEKKLTDSNILSAIIVVVLPVVFYIYVQGYCNGFFERLSIPFIGLNLPLTFYISIIYFTSAAALLLLITIYFIWTNTRYRDNSVITFDLLMKYISIVVSLTIIKLIILPSTYYLLIHERTIDTIINNANYHFIQNFNNTFIDILLILTLWATFSMTCLISIPKIRHVYDSIKHDILLKPLFIIILTLTLLTLIYVLPYVLGYFSAGNLLDGLPGTTKITIEPIDGTMGKSNESLFVVLNLDNEIYAVEESNHTTENAKIHIINKEKTEITNSTIIKYYDYKRLPTDLMRFFHYIYGYIIRFSS